MPLYANTSLRFSLPLHHHQQPTSPLKVRVEYSCGSVEYTTACSTLSQVRGRIKKWETCKAKSWEAERTPMEFSAEITGDEGDRQAQSIG